MANIFEEKENSTKPDRITSLLNIIDFSNTQQKSLQTIRNLITKYNEIFHVPGDKLSKSTLLEMKIPMINNEPIFTKQFPIPHKYKDIMKEKIKELLDDDVIEEAMSPYNSPVILIPKKKGEGLTKYRFICDLRKINENIKKTHYPLPIPEEIIASLDGCLQFTTIDLNSGYHQLLVQEEDRDKLAFSVLGKSYRYKRIPQGCNISSCVFQYGINKCLQGLQETGIHVYLDDILIATKSNDDHHKALEQVLRGYYTATSLLR